MDISQINLQHGNFKKHAAINSKLIQGDFANKKEPFLTIAIPTYRRHRTLKNTVASAINQVNIPCIYEIIVLDNEAIDDGASNETQEMLSEYSNILYYRNDSNLGLYGNWNRCIQLSRSKWVAFLHDDDMLFPDYLEKIYKIIMKLKTDDALAYIKTNMSVKKDEFELEAVFRREREKHRIKKVTRYGINDIIVLGDAGELAAPTCGTIMNKEVVVKIGGFDPDKYPSADSQFAFSLAKKYHVYKTIESMGIYRIGLNETLKKEAIIAIIDNYVAYNKAYMMKQSRFGKMYARIFQKELDALFLDNLSSWIGLGGVTFEIKQINRECMYNPNKYKYWVLKKIIACHHIFHGLI